MAGAERFLPKERRFTTALTDVREPLVDILTENVENYKDVIDPAAEFSRPVVSLWKFTDGLSKIFVEKNESVEEVRQAMYRGICFGLQVVDDIRLGPIERFGSHYVKDAAEDDPGASIKNMIKADVGEYLGERPEIKSLLFSFLPSICEEYAYQHHAEVAAGFALMLCERQQAEAYMQNEMASIALRLTPELEYNEES